MRNVCNPWDPLLFRRLYICVCLSRDNSMVFCYVYWDTMDYLLKFQSLLLLPPGDVINSNCFPMLIFRFSISRLFLSLYFLILVDWNWKLTQWNLELFNTFHLVNKLCFSLGGIKPTCIKLKLLKIQLKILIIHFACIHIYEHGLCAQPRMCAGCVPVHMETNGGY